MLKKLKAWLNVNAQPVEKQQITDTDKDLGLFLINVLDLYLIGLLFAVPNKTELKRESADKS